MKWLLALFISLVLATSAMGQTITATSNHCNNTTTVPGTTSLACTFPGNTTAGNFVGCGVYWDSATESDLSSIVMNAPGVNATLLTNTWVVNDSQSTKQAFFANISTATTPSYTANFASGRGGIALACREFTNVISSNPQDKANTNTGTGIGTGTDAVTSGTTTTRTQANELLLGWTVSTNISETFNGGTGYTESDKIVNWGTLEYKITGSCGNEAATWTAASSGVDHAASISTYLDSTSGATCSAGAASGILRRRNKQ